MGSSKKHKEKDREHKRKKHRRSRSRSRERKRHRRGYDDDPEVDRPRESRDAGGRYSESMDYDQPPEPPRVKDEEGVDEPSKEQLSLSIEETNKLRAKLGLKPLETGGSGNASKASSENPDVHVPAINLGEKQRTEKLRERMSLLKEKRTIQSKLGAVKGLGDSDSEEDSAVAWVKKSRKLQKEKDLAEKRAKLLEEMDEEFGVGSLVDQEFKGRSETKYTSSDLSGLRVEHAMEKFKEGSNVILTLKDKGVLDEEDDDVLVNVNIVDDETAEKNVENKKKKPEYKPYDEPEYDEYGMLKPKDVLDKYDEEIHGAKKESFTLGSGGKYDAEHERNMERIRQELRRQGQSLTGPALTIASEYMTPEEMNAKFKKVKKKVRKIRKKEVLKADDLLPLPDQEPQTSDYGSRNRGRGVKVEADEDSNSQPAAEPVIEDAAFHTGILIKKEPQDTSGFRPPPPPPGSAPDDEDIVGPEEDLSGVAVEEEQLQQELQSILHKTRKLTQKKERKLGAQRVVEAIKQEPEMSEAADGSSKPGPSSAGSSQKGQAGGNIILNSTSEFCRTLGEIPTYGLAGNREEEREEIMDLELELMEQRKQEMELEDQQTGWNEVDIDTNPINIGGEETSVLEEEPVVSASIGSALQLAMKKGYLEQEMTKKHSSAPKHSHLQAQNYSIEDKRYDDLEEKFRKRDRYGGGMITDFKDKDGYKPEIRLEYVDDSGRMLNPKEAFRQLSHRFHGKGSGKKKTEKRMKKVEEENLMKQMSSTDTPLNTLSLLQDKQRTEKSPYVILSGNKTFSSNSQTLSKPYHQ